MKKAFVFVMIVTLIFSVISVRASSEFSDVSSRHYAYEAINKLKACSIVNGYPNRTFGPDNPVTRAEMAVLMCRMSEETPTDEKSTFTDVADTHWASGYITKAAKKNIIAGDGKGSFRPEDFVTYEEAVKMMVMATGCASNVGTYPGSWSASFLKIASLCKITDNLNSLPGENVTRADVAVMIYNALRIKSNPDRILFAKHIYNEQQNIPTNAAFDLDLSLLNGDNTKYNKELAKASAVLSMTAYDYINPNSNSNGNTDSLLKQLGFNTVHTIETKEKYSDNHITKMYIGKRKLKQAEKETQIISVVFRGTDGSSKEWASNFDIGSGEDNDVYTKENHRGYDITARRCVEEIEKYISDNTSSDAKRILWITGHSRGASLANLCGAYLADKGETCFVYSFAPAQSTTRQDAGKYGFIFNVVNTDDIITYVPLSQWGFKNLGKTARVSLGGKYLKNWQESTALANYKFKDNISHLVTKISDFSPSRKACYEYIDEDVILTGVSTTAEGETLAQNYINLFSNEAKPYFTYEIKKAPMGWDTPYIVVFNMQPAFYMQSLGAAMADHRYVSFLLMLPVPKQVESAYSAAMSSYSGGIVHPHTPETYYVLAENITSEDFK